MGHQHAYGFKAFVLCLGLTCVQACSNIQTHKTLSPSAGCSDGTVSIEANFDGANMGRCEVVGERSFRLYLSPEDNPINNSPWYAFRVFGTDGTAGTVDVEMRYELHSHRYAPKLSVDRDVWTLLDADQVDIREDGKVVTLSLDMSEGPLWIAGQELVTQLDYERWMRDLESQYGAVVSTIGQSRDGRPIYLLESDVVDMPAKETLVLLGRAHPPEVTGALAMRQFVDHLFEQHQEFLKTHKLFIVPLLNPDGVARGYWRHGLGGLDLNRDWGPFSQPETAAVVRALDQRIEQGMRIRMMLDFHSTHRNVFYTQTDKEDAEMGSFTARWFEQAKKADVYPFEHAQRHNAGRPTSKNYFHGRFQVPAITYELADSAPRDEIVRSTSRFADALVQVLEEMQRER